MVAAVGSPQARHRLLQRWPGRTFLTVVSSHAWVAEGAFVGEGTTIAPCVTNLVFLRKVLASDEFRAGAYDTKFAEVLAKR